MRVLSGYQKGAVCEVYPVAYSNAIMNYVIPLATCSSGVAIPDSYIIAGATLALVRLRYNSIIRHAEKNVKYFFVRFYRGSVIFFVRFLVFLFGF